MLSAATKLARCEAAHGPLLPQLQSLAEPIQLIVKVDDMYKAEESKTTVHVNTEELSLSDAASCTSSFSSGSSSMDDRGHGSPLHLLDLPNEILELIVSIL